MAITDVEVEVRHSSRATKPRIDVDLDGVTVVVPEGMNLNPRDLLNRKEDWVRKKLREMEELRERVPDRRFREGECFPYFGEEREVVVSSRESSRVTEAGFELARQQVKDDGVQSELEALYRREAETFISSVVERYAPRLGVSYGTIRVKNQKTLWGSCSSKDNLNFNWRIVMAPREIAEYVVLHELCHLVHPNHSDAFWKLLADYTDDPRSKARWLRDHAVELIYTEEDL